MTINNRDNILFGEIMDEIAKGFRENKSVIRIEYTKKSAEFCLFFTHSERFCIKCQISKSCKVIDLTLNPEKRHIFIE